MKILATALVFGAFVASTATADDFAGSDGYRKQHAVFVMTNDADANEVIAYERSPLGVLPGLPAAAGLNGIAAN